MNYFYIIINFVLKLIRLVSIKKLKLIPLYILVKHFLAMVRVFVFKKGQKLIIGGINGEQGKVYNGKTVTCFSVEERSGRIYYKVNIDGSNDSALLCQENLIAEDQNSTFSLIRRR